MCYIVTPGRVVWLGFVVDLNLLELFNYLLALIDANWVNALLDPPKSTKVISWISWIFWLISWISYINFFCVCLCVCYVFVTEVTNPYILAKNKDNYTKVSYQEPWMFSKYHHKGPPFLTHFYWRYWHQTFRVGVGKGLEPGDPNTGIGSYQGSSSPSLALLSVWPFSLKSYLIFFSIRT